MKSSLGGAAALSDKATASTQQSVAASRRDRPENLSMAGPYQEGRRFRKTQDRYDDGMNRNPFDMEDSSLFDIQARAAGPAGALPLTPEMLRERPSGDLFGWSQNAGMGWNPAALGGKEYLILSTHGGVRAPDGTPIALGYHTGHWEVGLLVEAAARTFSA